MMHKLIFLALVFSCFACQTQITDEVKEEAPEENVEQVPPPPEMEINSPADSFFVFYPKAKISDDLVKGREAGKNIVFHYYFKNTDYANISDEGYTEEIIFEIPLIEGQKSYSTKQPIEFNTRFDWGCFCDWPDEKEAKQNNGAIYLNQLNDTSWQVEFTIRNIPLRNVKTLTRKFYEYQPSHVLAGQDTLNKTDRFKRKQGHWITESKYETLNGIYTNNYFTGSEFNYMYYKGDYKTLISVQSYENNEWGKSISYDQFGKQRK